MTSRLSPKPKQTEAMILETLDQWRDRLHEAQAGCNMPDRGRVPQAARPLARGVRASPPGERHHRDVDVTPTEGDALMGRDSPSRIAGYPSKPNRTRVDFMSTQRFTTAILAVASVLAIGAFAPQEVPLAPHAAQAAVTASISGEIGGGIFAWQIEYDDTTREVTTVATGTGFCIVTVKVTATITRTVAYYPSQGAQSTNPDMAQRMAAADFQVISDGGTVVLASSVPPAAVRRIVGKPGSLGGLESQSEWWPR